MSRRLEFPRPLAWDRDYWLCRCEGFKVDAPAGRLGFVEAVRFGSRLDRPDELLVRGGILGNRRLVVAVADVDEVLPLQQLVILLHTPEHRHDRFARVLAHASRKGSQEAPQSKT
jgi:hypothetical protein